MRALEAAQMEAKDLAQRSTSFRDVTGSLRRSIVTYASRWSGNVRRGFVRAGARHAIFVEEDTRAHVIQARRGRALAFRVAGATVFARRVNHPGTKGTHFMAKAGAAAAHVLEQASKSGIDGAIARHNSR